MYLTSKYRDSWIFLTLLFQITFKFKGSSLLSLVWISYTGLGFLISLCTHANLKNLFFTQRVKLLWFFKIWIIILFCLWHFPPFQPHPLPHSQCSLCSNNSQFLKVLQYQTRHIFIPWYMLFPLNGTPCLLSILGPKDLVNSYSPFNVQLTYLFFSEYLTFIKLQRISLYISFFSLHTFVIVSSVEIIRSGITVTKIISLRVLWWSSG